MILCTSPALGWPGHKWEDWHALTKMSRPSIRSPQSGRLDLVPLMRTEGPDSPPIATIQAWETKRARIVKTLETLLGEPTNFMKPPVEAVVLGEEKLDGYIRRHIKIRTESDDWIPAYMLLPDPPPARKTPTMICLHQTVAQGKQEPCGMKGNASLTFALDLVRQGYCCIAPDVIGFGERIPVGEQPYHDAITFYKRHPNWSFVGKMVWDVSRIIDYLETLPFVDARRIGSIGHSHGAYGTLFAAALEPRITCAVASCGFTTLRTDPRPDRWSHLTALIPQLGLYLPDELAEIPIDWHEIVSLVAPRALFNRATLEDAVFPNTDNLDGIFTELQQVYGLYGSADMLGWKIAPGGHRFSDEAHQLAFGFLAKQLPRREEIDWHPKNPDELAVLQTRIRTRLERTLGPVPVKPPPLAMKELERESVDGFERRLISYAVEPGERVKAYLFVPTGREHPQPGIVVFHQTTHTGKREAAGLEGKPSLHFASDLVRRGYVTLAPDSITAGERIDAGGAFNTGGFYRRHPSWSAMGKMIYDGRRALDLMQSLTFVDGSRLGAIGHSLGAEEAMMVAAFDDRIKAAVASCGFSTFAADSRPTRWARDHWFVYMPRLRSTLLQNRLPDWDFDDLIKLIAPRGYFNYATTEDGIFPEGRSAHDATMTASHAWHVHDADIVSVLEPGPHGISDQAKSRAYAWLDRQLGNATK